MSEPTVNPQTYDPDAPPASAFGDFIGELVITRLITPADLSNSEQHVQEAITRFWDKSGGRQPGPVWYLEAHGLSHQRTDGTPYKQSDIIWVVDKDGKWLGKKQTPDRVAQQYRGLGVSASYAQVGQPQSAQGRAFHFVEQDLKLGTNRRTKVSYGKTVTLWPVEIYPAGYKYAGEVTMVEPRREEDAGVNGSVPAAPKVTSERAVEIFREQAVGKTPGDLFNIVLASAELKSVGMLFGVQVMEAATDDRLGAVLVENGVLKLNDAGVYEVPA